MPLSQLTGINNPSNKFTNSDTLPADLTFRILLFSFAFLGFIFIYRIIASGYMYLTSVGDPNKVQSASKNLINAFIGLFLVLAAYLISQVIFAILGINTVLIP